MNSINKLISIVNDSDIFSDNSSITKLLSILNNSSATAKNVSDAIELNPPLASRVLQLSNSPFFGGNGRITSIKKAITWIGFTQVKEITLNLSLSNLFTGGESIGDYNRKSLWKHSIAAGVMCKQIARKLFRERGDTQYSVGILHDFGFLIEDYFHHNELVNLLNSNELKKNKLEDLENNVFGFNHIDVTVELLKSWGLPKIIINPIKNHLNPLEADNEFFQDAAILFISNYYLQKSGYYFKSDLLQNTDVYKQLIKKLNISVEAIDILFEDVVIELDELDKQGWL